MRGGDTAQERLKLNSNRRLNRTVARSLSHLITPRGHEINEVGAEAAVIDKNNFSPLKSVSRFCFRPLSLGASSSLSTFPFLRAISIFQAHSAAHSLSFFPFFCVSHFSALSVSSEWARVSLVCKMMIPLLITY